MTEILHLSTFLHRPIFDSDGDRIGRVQDLVARLGDDPHPPIVGAVIRIEGRDLFVPIKKIGGLAQGRMTFEGRRVDLRRFERRPGEMLLAEDLLARHLINLVRGRIIIANEIEIAEIDGRWEVVGVDPGSPVVLCVASSATRSARTCRPTPLSTSPQSSRSSPTCRRRDCASPTASWPSCTPPRSPTSSSRPATKRARRSSKRSGSTASSRPTSSRSSTPTHQLEFFESRSDAEAARLLSRMEPDNAADLITEIDQERRLPILELLPSEQQAKVRQLLSYNADTAGGLMNPDFVSVPRHGDRGRRPRGDSHLPACPRSRCRPSSSSTSRASRLAPRRIAPLVRARPSELALTVARTQLAHVHPHWDVHRMSRKMSDFNLTVLPVLDDEHSKMIGVVTVDDLLEELLPQGWRAEFGMSAVEE